MTGGCGWGRPGRPADLSRQPGVTFDLIFMTVQAGVDGLGVAMGRTAYVQEDIAKGRLVVPFKITLPVDAGFYLVSPAGRTDPPKLSAFRKWLICSAQAKSSKSGIPRRQGRARDLRLVGPRRRGRLPHQGRITVSTGGIFAGAQT